MNRLPARSCSSVLGCYAFFVLPLLFSCSSRVKVKNKNAHPNVHDDTSEQAMRIDPSGFGERQRETWRPIGIGVTESPSEVQRHRSTCFRRFFGHYNWQRLRSVWIELLADRSSRSTEFFLVNPIGFIWMISKCGVWSGLLAGFIRLK